MGGSTSAPPAQPRPGRSFPPPSRPRPNAASPWTQAYPKPLTDSVLGVADVIVTMGCGDTCPIFPGKRYEDWDLDDPAGQDLATVRGIRDQIRERVTALLTELSVESTSQR